MAKSNSYIKLNRSILDWRWYKDANTFRVFIHLILNANFADGYFEKEAVLRGEFASSLDKLAKDLNLSVQNVRTAISHLKSTGELTSRNCGKYQVFTIVNYPLYQGVLTSKLTSNQQGTNKELTTSKEEKEYKNNNIYIYTHACARGEYKNVLLTDAEVQSLVNELGEERYKQSVECLSKYIKRKPQYFSASHFEDLRGWVQDKLDEKAPKKTKNNTISDKAIKAGFDINLDDIFEKPTANRVCV